MEISKFLQGKSNKTLHDVLLNQLHNSNSISQSQDPVVDYIKVSSVLFITYKCPDLFFSSTERMQTRREGQAERKELKEDEGEVQVWRLQRLLEDLSQRTSSQIPFHLCVLGFHQLSTLQTRST